MSVVPAGQQTKVVDIYHGRASSVRGKTSFQPLTLCPCVDCGLCDLPSIHPDEIDRGPTSLSTFQALESRIAVSRNL